MPLAFTFSAMILLSASSSLARTGGEADCLMGLAPALSAGSFSGSTDCRSDRLTIRRVGNIRVPSRTFTVFDYHYKLKPVCPECAVHGGQRIIIMSRGRYFGQFHAAFAKVFIRRNKLVLVPDGSYAFGSPTIVTFTARGPKHGSWFDDGPLSFFR